MVSNTYPKREEYLKKKRNRKIVRYALIVFLLLLIIGLTSYISFRPELRISKAVLTGGVLVTEEAVEEKSFSYMNGNYFWLFPKNNALWYSRKGLEKYLSDEFQRIATINIRRENFQTLAIQITERQPFAIWCDGVRLRSTDDEILSSAERSADREEGNTEDNNPRCYFMDQNGTIFSEAPYFSGDAYFKYYGLVLDDSPIGKKYIASSTKFSEISDFISTTKKLSIGPQYLLAKEGDEFSLFIRGGGVIYFDTKEPLSVVGQNLEALLRTPALSSTTYSNVPVEYIDLRYGNKLFYRLKQ